MHESSTDSEVTFRRGLGSAKVLTTRPGVDPLEVTRPLPDFSWTTQSPQATSPSVMVRPGMQPPVASHVFGPSTTQVEPETPHRTTPENPHRENLQPLHVTNNCSHVLHGMRAGSEEAAARIVLVPHRGQAAVETCILFPLQPRGARI